MDPQIQEAQHISNRMREVERYRNRQTDRERQRKRENPSLDTCEPLRHYQQQQKNLESRRTDHLKRSYSQTDNRRLTNQMECKL